MEGLTTLEELLKIIELDDDSRVKATGLENAIEANELTQQDLLNHQEGIILKAKEQIIKNEETENKIENNLINKVPEKLVEQTPVENEKVIEPIQPKIEEKVIENTPVLETTPQPQPEVKEKVDQTPNVPNFSDKRNLFSNTNKNKLF